MRYQILRRQFKGDNWTFMAHGAQYDDEGAEAACAMVARCSGGQTKLIPLDPEPARGMKAADHIVAWIESDRKHYDRLLDLYRRRQPDAPDGYIRVFGIVATAHNIASSAYSEMLMTGDASRSDPYSATDILQAAIALAEWELES